METGDACIITYLGYARNHAIFYPYTDYTPYTTNPEKTTGNEIPAWLIRKFCKQTRLRTQARPCNPAESGVGIKGDDGPGSASRKASPSYMTNSLPAASRHTALPQHSAGPASAGGRTALPAGRRGRNRISHPGTGKPECASCFLDGCMDVAHLAPELACVRGEGYDKIADDFAQREHLLPLTSERYGV